MTCQEFASIVVDSIPNGLFAIQLCSSTESTAQAGNFWLNRWAPRLIDAGPRYDKVLNLSAPVAYDVYNVVVRSIGLGGATSLLGAVSYSPTVANAVLDVHAPNIILDSTQSLYQVLSMMITSGMIRFKQITDHPPDPHWTPSNFGFWFTLGCVSYQDWAVIIDDSKYLVFTLGNSVDQTQSVGIRVRPSEIFYNTTCALNSKTNTDCICNSLTAQGGTTDNTVPKIVLGSPFFMNKVFVTDTQQGLFRFEQASVCNGNISPTDDLTGTIYAQ